MHSPADYIVAKEEVHGHANHGLDSSLTLEYERTKHTAGTILQVLLM